MKLIKTQCEAAERGVPIPISLPGSDVEFVIVRRDLVEKWAGVWDDSPCDPEDLLRITVEVLDDEDWSEFEQPPVNTDI